MPDDQQAGVRILVETRREILQIRRGVRLDAIRVEIEQQARLESDLDALAHALHDRAGDVLLQLLRLLVHLVANDCADRAADGRADDRSLCGRAIRPAHRGAGRSTDCRADDRALFLIRERCAPADRQRREHEHGHAAREMYELHTASFGRGRTQRRTRGAKVPEFP